MLLHLINALFAGLRLKEFCFSACFGYGRTPEIMGVYNILRIIQYHYNYLGSQKNMDTGIFAKLTSYNEIRLNPYTTPTLQHKILRR